jgi:AraC-like DNA-binding protein
MAYGPDTVFFPAFERAGLPATEKPSGIRGEFLGNLEVTLMTTRRPVGGQNTLAPAAPAPRRVDRRARGDLASLLAALDEIRSLVDTDLILRRAIELVRDRIGLRRAGLFVLDRSRNLMLGTWGMDLSCSVVDEHHVIYDLCGSDLEALRRSEEEGAHFSVFDSCPIIEHQGGETRIAGRGWVAKTPIRSTHAAIGMLFNDAGLTDDPVDEVKQAHAAIFCSVLGAMLDPMRGWLVRCTAPGASPGQRLVASTVEMLDGNPSLGGKEIAGALNISLSRLARVFKTLMGMSLVEYRNRLRLDRFESLLEHGPANLLDAALEAGFGSYAQFHRVFRARLHASPRDYLRPAGGGRRLLRSYDTNPGLPSQLSKFGR